MQNKRRLTDRNLENGLYSFHQPADAVHEACHPTCKQCEAVLQHRRGIPVYWRSVLQPGHGVGGLFRRLASGLLPMLPTLGKAALGVVSDKMSGIPLSRALKTRGLVAGRTCSEPFVNPQEN